MTMSRSEFSILLHNFERDYDPFGTYNSSPLTESYSYWNNGMYPNLLWKSGNDDLSALGTHELLTARACGILLHDKGFWGTNENGSILIALTLSLASIKPDKDAFLGKGQFFAGHFYDPDTGKNWAGSSINTAYTNMNKYYNAAKKEYTPNDLSEDFILNIGKAIHYMQDACEPHHAANYIAGPTVHSEFEEQADLIVSDYIDQITTLDESYYTTARNTSQGNILKNYASIAKGYAPVVQYAYSTPQAFMIAGITLTNSVISTAMLLYKLSLELNIPLHK